MRYYISIDGGGTKTEGVVVNTDGQVLRRVVSGSSNPNDIGIGQAINRIKGVVKNLTYIDATDIFVVVGGSGMSSSGIKEQLEIELVKLPAVQKAEVVSDIDFAFSSINDPTGCILIIGTGCVAYFKKNGKPFVIGGGGYMIDDLLSGFDLGRAVLNAVLEEHDGRGEKTVLTDAVLQMTGKEIWQTIKDVYINGKCFVAKFAPLLFDGLSKKDTVSIKILRQRVANLEKLLLSAYKNCGEPVLNITIFGGLSNQFDIIYSFISEELKQKLNFIMPKYPIILGGINYIVNADEEFRNKFLDSYNSAIINKI